MKTTTYSGQSVFLCPFPPNWGEAPVEAKFSTLTKAVVGKTNHEEREALAKELRCTMTYAGLLDSTESASLRAALGAWDNRPVLCPFWPAVSLVFGGSNASVTGALKCWFEPDFSRYEIGTGSGPVTFAPSSQCLVAPVLWGRFGEFPTLTAINGLGDHAVQFEFVENGAAAFALTPTAATLTTTVINSQTVPKLTVPFTWGDNTAIADVRIKRSTVGFGRADSDDYLPQWSRTKQTMQFEALNTDEVSYLLTLFKDRSGSVRSWQCPAIHDASVMSLGRFDADMLSIRWTVPAPNENASSSVEFITLPTEAVPVAGETPGVNLGGTPDRFFGYVVTDGAQTWRYTSYESAIVVLAGTFSPAKINHGTITEEINLAVNDCTLTVTNWAGSPFTRLRNQPNAPGLTVSIYEGKLSNPEAMQLIYTGEAQAPNTDGPAWQIKLKGPTAILDLKGPRYVLQPTCLATLGDSKCGLNLATLSVTKTLLSIVGDVATFSDATGLADHRFAAGSAERTYGGITIPYMIVDSRANTDGNLELVLAGVVTPAPTVGETWTLIPGCDGQMTTCQGFGNLVNLRAAPYLPKVDPAMVSIPASGGKK
jgi:uncharacterized phage protein (TIGR02218 family)